MFKLILKQHWFLWLMLSVSWLLLPHADTASWQRSAILGGHYWRLLSGNFCHNNFTHWLMNIAALILIYFCYNDRLSNRQFLQLSLIISGLGGYALLYGPYSEYVGLSALIHGLIAYAACIDIIKGRAKIGMVVVLGLAMKLLFEQIYGADPWIKQMIGIDIAIDAHLIYTLIGLSLAQLSWLPLWRNRSVQ
ncbi:rhombosortase [Agarivorans sp. QJM3NY_25]|uniref:rhombosortase n=1 Tax=Agarivorans sp. QJM3NY_25 TaxID=3421430 RepID=UPI003D7E9F76